MKFEVQIPRDSDIKEIQRAIQEVKRATNEFFNG